MVKTTSLEEMLDYSTSMIGSASISIKLIDGKYRAVFYEEGKQIIFAEGNSIISAISKLEIEAFVMLER